MTKEEHHDQKPFVSGHRPPHSTNHPNRYPEPQPIIENKPPVAEPSKPKPDLFN